LDHVDVSQLAPGGVLLQQIRNSGISQVSLGPVATGNRAADVLGQKIPAHGLRPRTKR
jgi:hypothetical protein